jgi:DNA-binding transcriptional MerR regulator
MSPAELCQRYRITPRELQWWHDKGVIASTRTARGRDFDVSQALAAAIVAELRYKGVSLHRIRKLQIGTPQGEYLVIAGPNTACWCSRDGLIPHVAGCPGPCRVVSVEDLRKRLYDQDPPRFARRKAN